MSLAAFIDSPLRQRLQRTFCGQSRAVRHTPHRSIHFVLDRTLQQLQFLHLHQSIGGILSISDSRD